MNPLRSGAYCGVGVGGMRAYPQIKWVCLFLDVILVQKSGSKTFFEKFPFLPVCP